MLSPVQHQYWDTNYLSEEQVSPIEPFTEVQMSPHHWPGSKIYTSQDISRKPKENWLRRLLIYSHSSSLGAEKPEGQTLFFPDVGHSIPCVTFSSQ